MTTENDQNELPVEFEILAMLELIEQNTERTKLATRAIGQLILIPMIGTVIGGVITLLGWIGGGAAFGGIATGAGVLVALGYLLAAVFAASSNLAKSK